MTGFVFEVNGQRLTALTPLSCISGLWPLAARVVELPETRNSQLAHSIGNHLSDESNGQRSIGNWKTKHTSNERVMMCSNDLELKVFSDVSILFQPGP